MSNYAFLLLPLYIYPSSPDSWTPLFNAAKAQPNVTFRAVINPDSGPGSGACPRPDFVNALTQLNAIPNIQTLAYVHTSIDSNCGPEGNHICSCSAPMDQLKANISTYQHWPSSNCSTGDLHVDGIFFDEAPANTTCYEYMSSAVAYTKQTLTNGTTTLFNVGSKPDPSYFDLADYINVFEGVESAYRSASLSDLTANGRKSTILIQSYSSGTSKLAQDVQAVLGEGSSGAGIAGMGASNFYDYNEFASFFDAFAAAVNAVGSANNVVGSAQQEEVVSQHSVNYVVPIPE